MDRVDNRQNRQIAVEKRTNQITFETSYEVHAHGTEIRATVDKSGVRIKDLTLRDADELELFAIVTSKAWAQYLKVRPKIEVMDRVPEIYQQELPGIK